MDIGVLDLGKVNVFLGHDWLKTHNPHIDWTWNLLNFDRCPPKCWPRSEVSEPEDEGESPINQEEGQLIVVYFGHAHQTISGEIKKKPLNEIVPKHYLKHK